MDDSPADELLADLTLPTDLLDDHQVEIVETARAGLAGTLGVLTEQIPDEPNALEIYKCMELLRLSLHFRNVIREQFLGQRNEGSNPSNESTIH